MCLWCEDCCLPAHRSGSWTGASIGQHVAAKQATLPLAEMQPGNVVKISGWHGFFNERPLMNPQWTDGRMSQAEYVSLIRSINAVAGECYVGLRKSHFDQQHLQGGTNEALAAVRAWLTDVASPWWLRHRGINIEMQMDEWKDPQPRMYQSERLCHLFLAIRSDQAPPPLAEGQTHEAPPVYPPQQPGLHAPAHAHTAAPGPPAQTMETGTHAATMAHAQSAQTA